MNLNRFKQLLESQMGNVKPLIMEQSHNKNVYEYFKDILDKNFFDSNNNTKELRINNDNKFSGYYEYDPKIFWEALDDFFGNDPKPKVYVDNKEIIRPK